VVIRDLTNKRFGRLIAIELNGKDNFNRNKWLCLCDCGNYKTINSRHLINNKTLSCGCYSKEISSANGKKSGYKISGSKSYLYKNHITDIDREKRRNTYITQIKNWREEIFKRDNYKCDLCNEAGGRLQAHHLNSWAFYKELRFDLKNGITLCQSCHKKFHGLKGGQIKKCTEFDYINYKYNGFR
jgi:hypothetical protein